MKETLLEKTTALSKCGTLQITHLIRDIKDPLLNLVINLCSCVDKCLAKSTRLNFHHQSIRAIKNCLHSIDDQIHIKTHIFHIVSCLGRCLHEHQTILLRKLFTFLCANCSSVGQVTLVAYKHDGHVGVGMLPCIIQPACQVVESFSPACLTLSDKLLCQHLKADQQLKLHEYTQKKSCTWYLVISYTNNAPAAPL